MADILAPVSQHDEQAVLCAVELALVLALTNRVLVGPLFGVIGEAGPVEQRQGVLDVDAASASPWRRGSGS